jgi:hypothetical protein
MDYSNRSPSLPLMDIDTLPDELVGVDDAFVGTYIQGLRGALLVTFLRVAPSARRHEAPASTVREVQHFCLHGCN